MYRILLAICLVCSMCTFVYAQEKNYVGSEACMDCHEVEYGNFEKFSKKPHAGQSILKMDKDLSPEKKKTCYACHTTGYGKSGGFISFEKTPEMAQVGCEACHGPGSLHVEDGDPESIILKPSMDTCHKCHDPKVVLHSDTNLLMFSGAH